MGLKKLRHTRSVGRGEMDYSEAKSDEALSKMKMTPNCNEIKMGTIDLNMDEECSPTFSGNPCYAYAFGKHPSTALGRFEPWRSWWKRRWKASASAASAGPSTAKMEELGASAGGVAGWEQKGTSGKASPFSCKDFPKP